LLQIEANKRVGIRTKANEPTEGPVVTQPKSTNSEKKKQAKAMGTGGNQKVRQKNSRHGQNFGWERRGAAQHKKRQPGFTKERIGGMNNEILNWSKDSVALIAERAWGKVERQAARSQKGWNTQLPELRTNIGASWGGEKKRNVNLQT